MPFGEGFKYAKNEYIQGVIYKNDYLRTPRICIPRACAKL